MLLHCFSGIDLQEILAFLNKKRMDLHFSLGGFEHPSNFFLSLSFTRVHLLPGYKTA